MGLLRIIAGELKGRRIRVPPAPDLRPTGERVREALFAILGGAVEGAHVLDAFAGSGALGFEALSRGAAHVVFVDVEPRVVGHLRDTARVLGVTARCRIVEGPFLRVMRSGSLGGPFDLLLVDPPWASDLAAPVLEWGAGVLAPDGVVVLEREARSEAPEIAPGTLVRSRVARYGHTCLEFYHLPGQGRPWPG